VYKRPPQLWRNTDMMRNAAKHVDAFISPDRHTIGKHREWWADMPLVYIPHFVPAVELASTDSSTPPYFLFAGRLEKLKGLQTLLPLFRAYPHAQLWIAGSGTYEAELRALAGDSPNIKFLGYQSGTRFQELYRRAIAVIAPSVNYEVAPPLVVMEAYRQQTPALVLNIGSMPEIIADSGGGYVYDAVDDLREKMDRLCADRSLRDELGMRGYTAFREQWSAEPHLARYFDLIDEVAVRRGVALG
jgi:glycosyltransferase involved in cell wall biosynthesis